MGQILSTKMLFHKPIAKIPDQTEIFNKKNLKIYNENREDGMMFSTMINEHGEIFNIGAWDAIGGGTLLYVVNTETGERVYADVEKGNKGPESWVEVIRKYAKEH